MVRLLFVCFVLPWMYLEAIEYKVCVTHNDVQLCDQMKEDTKVLPHSFLCTSGRDKIDCMKKVMRSEADIVNLGANEAYVAALNYNLEPILQEERDSKTDGIMYEAVAVVKKSAGITSLKDLKGKRSCHTGYGRNAGWSIPVSILRAAGVAESECDEVAAMSAFFAQSCVPGAWSSDSGLDKELKMHHTNLCDLCKTKCEDPNDPYVGYSGALKCLTETKAEVAFTKFVSAKEFFATHPNRMDYQYLCLNGSTVSLDDNCFWASRPNNFIMARKNLTSDESDKLRRNILDVFSRFESPKRPWMEKTIISNNSVTALSLEQLPIADVLDKYNYRITVDKPLPKTCPEKYVYFCVTSKVEMEKCRDFKVASFAQRLRPQIECHLENSATDCLKAIRDGKADVMAADSGEVFLAHKEFSLVPIISEVYEASNTSYYAVAVVHSTSDIRSLADLKGKKSCHTGFGRTAGWNVPVGTLKRNGLIKEDGCSIQSGVASFFAAGCVPGIKGSESLCKQCIGDEKGAHVCEASSTERYYSYSGAFRCLAEKAGDVAFVKHTTVSENLDVPDPPEWARGFRSQDFSLLCLDGDRRQIRDYSMCSWARVASHKLVTSKAKDEKEVMYIKLMFLRASSAFGPTKDLFKLFGKYNDGKDLLFKDSATGLQAIPAGSSVSQALGQDFYDDLQSTFCASFGTATRASLTSILALCLAFVFLQQRMCLPFH